MDAQLRFIALMALLGLGSYGWGSAIVAVALRSNAEPEAREQLGAAMRVSLGVALFLGIGGIAVAAGIADFATLIAWQATGAVLGCALFVGGGGATRLRGANRLTLGLWTASGLILGLLSLGAALTGPYNSNDDDPAYLYLAQRLLSTGGMIDPFNTRRIYSYGGGELFQAPVLRVTGTAGELGVEWFFFALLLVALFGAMFHGSRRRGVLLVGVLAVGLGVVLVRPVGLWANVAPTFSGSALSLGLLQLLGGARRAGRELWRYVLAGLLLGGLLALRLEFFVLAAVALTGTALFVVRGRRGLLALLVAGATVLAALFGWAVALQRSSGTPLFVLSTGNLTDASRGRDPALRTFAQFLRRVGAEATTDHWSVAVLGSLLLVALALARRRYSRPYEASTLERTNALAHEAATLTLFLLGCLAQLALDAWSLSGAWLGDIGRYNAPATLAALLFALGVTWRSLATPWARPGASERVRRLRLDGATTATALVALAGLALELLVLAVGPAAYRSAISTETRAAAHVVTGGALIDHWAADRAGYAKLDARIPAGAHVLSAVELPALLDFSRFSFATLDVVGGASPPPHLPIADGASAIVTYLRALGYDGIAAVSPNA